MITKSILQESLDRFPEEFTLEELIEQAILIDKIQRGNQQSERGETVSEEELDKEMSKWFE